MPELALQSSEQERLLAPLDTAIAKFVADCAELSELRQRELDAKRPVAAHTAKLAQQLDASLRTFDKTITNSELAQQTSAAHKLHRWLSGMLWRKHKFIAESRLFCSRIMQEWNREQKAEAERAALKQEARQREFAAEHFPDMPIVAPHVERPRLDGVNIRDFWTIGRILDPVAFAKYLFDNPHHLAGVKMELNKNYWKQFLNNRAGTETPEIPGLEIVQEGSTTNRSNG